VFQLAHAVEEADFPLPAAGADHVERAWAEHQIATTVDFARDSRLASFFLGGLNFQVEHHLFPQICHVNYPVIAPVVERTCREFGLPYRAHRSFGAGVASHYRWLKRLSRPNALALA
jgi:linoleoyl-CoA desaturase